MQAVLNRVSVKSKLVAAFTLILTCAIALGVFSVARVAHLNRTAALIGTDVVASTALGRAAIDGERMLSLGLARQATASSAAKARLTTQLQAAAQDLNANWAAYVKDGLGTGDERRLASQEQQAWTQYARSLQEAADMDAAGNNDEAETYLETEVPKSVAAFRAAIGASVAFKQSQGAQAVAAAAVVGASARWMITLALLIMTAASVAIAWLMVATICRPLTRMAATMQSLASRDLQVDIPGFGRGDEIGRIAAAVLAFKDGMVAADRLGAEQDAERRGKEQRTVKLESLLAAFERTATRMVEHLSAGSAELTGTAKSMATTASHTDQRALTLNGAAAQASAGAQTVATAAQQLAASIDEIDHKVSQSKAITEKAVSESRRTDVIVRNLAGAADRIGNVVGLITKIASQTNLLALNATIEAARAADSGRAFAVVASEVKTLAGQTTRATEEIGVQIGQIQSATREAVEAIQGITTVIEEVSGIATVIAAAVAQQGAATGEIAQNVQHTARAAGDVTANVGDMRHASKQVEDAAGQVLGAAGSISDHAANLSVEVNRFLAEVRAA